jgi:hypothetical protein
MPKKLKHDKKFHDRYSALSRSKIPLQGVRVAKNQKIPRQGWVAKFSKNPTTGVRFCAAGVTWSSFQLGRVFDKSPMLSWAASAL